MMYCLPVLITGTKKEHKTNTHTHTHTHRVNNKNVKLIKIIHLAAEINRIQQICVCVYIKLFTKIEWKASDLNKKATFLYYKVFGSISQHNLRLISYTYLNNVLEWFEYLSLIHI